MSIKDFLTQKNVLARIWNNHKWSMSTYSLLMTLDIVVQFTESLDFRHFCNRTLEIKSKLNNCDKIHISLIVKPQCITNKRTWGN